MARRRCRQARAALKWAAWLSLLSGCVPDFVDDTTHVGGPRILAVNATPAEAKQGETVTLDALVAAPPGSTHGVPAWSLCVDRKPLSDLGPVSTDCLSGPDPGADIAEPVAAGPPVVAQLPATACQLFGPDRPDPKPGEPAGRPVDPDVTGGFYQPVLAWLENEPVLGGVRLSCPLTGASPGNTRIFNASYHANTNPAPLALEVTRADGTRATLNDAEPLAVLPEEQLVLHVTWPECAPDAESCGGAENYVVYDALSQTIVSHTESLVASFYATSGVFAEPRTEGSTISFEGLPNAANTWTASHTAGPATLWAVVRDDRGGQAWLAGSLVVSP